MTNTPVPSFDISKVEAFMSIRDTAEIGRITLRLNDTRDGLDILYDDYLIYPRSPLNLKSPAPARSLSDEHIVSCMNEGIDLALQVVHTLATDMLKNLSTVVKPETWNVTSD